MDNLENILYSKESFYIDGLPYELIKAEYNVAIIKNLVLLIPGNPGLVGFYEHFIQALLENLDTSYAVWCVSHSGFCENDCMTASKPDALLAREIEHKQRFIDQKIPPEVDIILVGHSIGCYMIISLLNTLTNNGPMANSNTDEKRQNEDLYGRIKKCFFLFPTIERMKVSPNGQSLIPLLNYLQTACTLLAGLVSLLPYWCRKILVSLFLPLADENIISTAITLVTPKYVKNMLQLAENEFNSVLELDVKAIENSLSKIVIYYGKTDGWCPLFYRDEMLEKFPDILTFVDVHEIPHDFVTCKSSKMASILAKLIDTTVKIY